MNKKTSRIIVAVIVLVVILAGGYFFSQMGREEGGKSIDVVVVVEGEIIHEETVKTETETLAELIKEMNEGDSITFVYEESAYGMFITGITVNGTTHINNAETNVWWMYNSLNNKHCVEAGYCDGADILNISDGDKFEFNLSGMSTFE